MMWNMTLLLKNREQAVMLNFRGGDAAKKARDHIWSSGERVSPLVEIADDFGTTFRCWMSDVHGVLIQDLEGTFEAQAEQALIQARAQAKAQRRAAADPLLKPPTVVPMPGGFRQ